MPEIWRRIKNGNWLAINAIWKWNSEMWINEIGINHYVKERITSKRALSLVISEGIWTRIKLWLIKEGNGQWKKHKNEQIKRII